MRVAARGRRAWARIAAFIAAGFLVAIALLVVLRDPIAEAVVEAYLASEGASSEVRIDHWDRAGLTAQIKLGQRPDFVAERVTLAFDPQHWLPHLESVTVAGTQAHAFFDGHSVSFGPLQKLFDNLTAKRQTAKSWTDQFVRDPLPVSITGARATVETPAGPIEIAGQIEMLGAQLLRVEANVVPADLRRRDLALRIDKASLSGKWTGAGFDGLGSLFATASVPHPSGELHAAAIHATLVIRDLRARTQGAVVVYTLPSLVLHAEATRWISPFVATAPVLDVRLRDLEGRYESGMLIGSTKIAGTFAAQQVVLGPTPINQLMLDLGGAASASPDGQTIFTGHLTASAAIPDSAAHDLLRLLPVLGSDQPTSGAFAAAARAFRIDSSFRVQRNGDLTTVGLVSPATVTSTSGAKLVLTPIDGAGTWLSIGDRKISARSGIRLQDGGLPSANIVIDSLSLEGSNNFGTSVHGSVSGSTRFFHSAAISAAGALTSSGGTFTVTLNGCADARVGTVFAGPKPVITDVRARFCTPTAKPFVLGTQHGWTFASDLSAMSGSFVGAQTKLEGARGHIALEGGALGPQTGRVDFADGRLTDIFSWRRFEPLLVSGKATLAAGVWRGTAAIKAASQKKQIGSVRFSHKLATGVGEAIIDARDVVFVPNKFAPADISPLLVAIARADGKASFTGHVAWTPRELKSDGQLDVDALQFASPMGGAHGATTHIHFVSLLPPETDVNQALGVERIEWVSPLNGVSARFRLTPRTIELAAASATVANGTATVDPLTISFSSKSLSGVLKLSEVDVGTFLAGSNLGNKIHLQARLSGTIPFSLSNEGFRITNGFVAATKPGRISIDRSLWTSGASLSSNAMQDFAYQAMENLAFDRLQGKINSLPGGRLALVLHIEGRNDPPKQEEARVGLFALLRGQAFKERVPLPKGTPIDLTLDTSLNFDELLRAYQGVRSPTVEIKSK